MKWLALTGCLLWLFYPGLSDSQVPAFRDAYHFYYPQAVWLQHCAEQGSYFPSWNAEEGWGVSVAGQPSAALYYPLRWLWWLPALSVAQKFSLVIVVHLLIAAGGMKRAARKLGCTDSAAWLAAISFSLSCPVFFQHTNLIFLCSAAWIGFALAAVFDVLKATRRRHYVMSCSVFGCAASLMLLAGDPQAVANAFIVASVVFAAVFVQRIIAGSIMAAADMGSRSRQTLDDPSGDQSLATSATSGGDQSLATSATSGGGQSLRTSATSGFGLVAQCKLLGSHLLWLSGALVLVVTLGAIQWLPALRWAAHSGRVAVVVKHDVHETRDPSDLSPSSLPVTVEPQAVSGPSATPAVDAVLRRSRPVLSHRYDFSLSPWHALTCLWPTLGGHYLPNNSRLFSVLPAEGRMWIPALYFGCWPGLLLLMALYSKRCYLARTLKVVLLFAVLAALGNYSIVWLLRELLSGLGLTTLAANLPKDHVGSLTWMINGLVPGYSMFRYPAKWTVWIAAAVSLLAAQHLGHRPSREVILPRRLISVLLALSLAGLAVSGCLAIANGLGYSLDAWLAARVADPWLGPPSTRAITNSLAIAFGVPSVVLGLIMLSDRAVPSVGSGVSGKLETAESQAGSLGHLGSQAGSLRHWWPSLTLITLAEMTLCASCWVHFLPAPDADRASDFSVPADRNTDQLDKPFVWSNRGQADLQQDRFVQSPQSYAEDQASYQRVWLIGKLGLVAEVRCLHAALSVDPRELAQLRTWLSRRDRQLPQQPEIDQVLRELGVTHRLVRSQPATDASTIRQTNAPTQFTWQAIADTLPLCQVLVGRAMSPSTSRVAKWRWTSPDRLVIQISGAEVDYSEGNGIEGESADAERRATLDNPKERVIGADSADAERRATLDSVLIVRQTNDGGWLARDASGRSLAIRGQPLFVEVEMSDAIGEITLSRKWFW